MSRVRKVGALALIAMVVLGAAACSKDDDEPKQSDRKVISFGDAPEGSTDLGLCRTYDLDRIKEIIGGDEFFKRLPPAAIGQEGDAVTGESCAWERNDLNGDALSLRIEARDFGDDEAALLERFDELVAQAPDAEPVAGLGDAAVSTVTDEATVVQIRSGHYLVSMSSVAAGELEPVSLDTMKLLGGVGVEALP